jgi:predicted anti-sigma-YlaC factor YlaD
VSVVPTSMINPETGIPDLVRRLTDDSKRLAADEFRLAKLEARESIHTAARGATWIGVALGVSIVALVALTVALVAMSGVFVGSNYWLGALVVGAVEVAVGWWLLRRGLTRPSADD